MTIACCHCWRRIDCTHADHAVDAGWLCKRGRWYCPDCWWPLPPWWQTDLARHPDIEAIINYGKEAQ